MSTTTQATPVVLTEPSEFEIFEQTKTIKNKQQDRRRFLLSTDKTKLNVDVIHDFLSKDSYWCPGIQRWIIERAIKNCLCFGIYDMTDAAHNKQVGFARVITDYATFAYVVDVFVLPTYRSWGLSKWLISSVVAHKDCQFLRRWLLTTKDAENLYMKYGGFKPFPTSSHILTVHKPDIYKTLPAEAPCKL